MTPATDIISPNIKNFRQVGEFLLAGAAPDPIQAGYQELFEINCRAAINLWNDDNHSGKVAAAIQAIGQGMTYEYDPLPGVAIFDTEPRRRVIQALRSLLQKVKGGIVTFVSCQHGSDRTGMVIACYRIVHDCWPLEDALTEMHRYYITPLLSDIFEAGMRDFVEDFGAAIEAGEYADLVALCA